MTLSPNELPRIVAIETSGRRGSVAVARGPELLAVQALPPEIRHAAGLMPAIRDLTASQGWRPDQIDHVYLSQGPGSFTGLRIAIAIARALAQARGARGMRLVAVPSLEVIASNAPSEYGFVLPLLDAKRGQVFAARYLRDAGGELTDAPPWGCPAGLVDPADFMRAAVEMAGTYEGPGAIALLGEGVEYHRPALAGMVGPMGTAVTELDRTLWPGRAEIVHRLGYRRALRGQFTDPAVLLPLYIRLPEAEEVYRRKHGLPLDA